MLVCKYCANLSECIEDANLNGCEHNPDFDGERYCGEFKRMDASGVTVQQWISVDEKLPTEADGFVLVCHADIPPYNFMEPFVNAKHDRRVDFGHYSEHSCKWYGTMGGYLKNIAYWMPLPRPPKGGWPL